MVAGIFHSGSGLGNQLHRYVMTRILALDKGYEWGMVGTGNFKGKDFMNLDMGKSLSAKTEALTGKDQQNGLPLSEFMEKKIIENGVDIRGYDPEINFVQDNTIIDGEFQDEKYFAHRLPEIREWLKVKSLEMPNNVCVINVRGGEYLSNPDLILPPEYWERAVKVIQEKGINKFEVHTDDKIYARSLFADCPITQDMEINWRSIRYAKYLILSNSSFAILPSLLNENVKEIIAPKYWARHNTKVWALPQNYYKKFTYV